MRAINVQEVQAHFTALVEPVMSSASGPRRGKGPTANSPGRMTLWPHQNGYRN